MFVQLETNDVTNPVSHDTEMPTYDGPITDVTTNDIACNGGRNPTTPSDEVVCVKVSHGRHEVSYHDEIRHNLSSTDHNFVALDEIITTWEQQKMPPPRKQERVTTKPATARDHGERPSKFWSYGWGLAPVSSSSSLIDGPESAKSSDPVMPARPCRWGCLGPLPSKPRIDLQDRIRSSYYPS
ncbi:hypothetical protein F5Y05DRAFT_421678 [Hypoxylon sp. FL0543]|nr:hypothetical protein F5Y05DRAFT_421678 [Hypoxylon sp. FL0543]